MIINLYLNGVIIGGCDCIKVSVDQKIILEKIELLPKESSLEIEYLEVEVCVNTKKSNSAVLFHFRLFVLEKTVMNDGMCSLSFKTIEEVDNTDRFDQVMFDIFYKWSLNQIVDWKNNLKTIEERRTYAVSCAKWSGLPCRFLDRKLYKLDCRTLVDFPSFFIALGEVFIGDKGFFGLGLDSLSDCLIEIKNNNNGFLDEKLHIVEKQQAENILGKKYLADVVELLEEYRISVFFI